MVVGFRAWAVLYGLFINTGSISGNSPLFLCYVSVFMLTLAILITTALGYILNSDSIIHPDLFC